MDLWGLLVAAAAAVAGVVAVMGGARRVQEWVHEWGLGEKRKKLPPGDLGWPLFGNMAAFLHAFKSNDPDSFINSYIRQSVSFILALSFALSLSIYLSMCSCGILKRGRGLIINLKERSASLVGSKVRLNQRSPILWYILEVTAKPKLVTIIGYHQFPFLSILEIG